MESIDAAESIFFIVVGVVGEDVLGLYEPQKARTRPDKDRERLEQCSDADSACQLWKRMQRDTPSRPILSSEPGRSAVEDVFEHWGRVAGKDLPLERIDPAIVAPFLLDDPAPLVDVTLAQVSAVVAKYPRIACRAETGFTPNALGVGLE
jgi:hypothetical protein